MIQPTQPVNTGKNVVLYAIKRIDKARALRDEGTVALEVAQKAIKQKEEGIQRFFVPVGTPFEEVNNKFLAMA